MRKFILTMFLTSGFFSFTYAQKINAKLSGRLLLDGIYHIHVPDTLNHRINIVDLRLGGKVFVSDDLFCKIDVGFAGNKVSIKDAFLQYDRNGHCFRGGYMFGFFGIDQSSSTNDFIFNTGANVDEVFYPGRRVGLSYTRHHNKYYLSAGVFLGDALTSDDNAVRNGHNASLRWVWRPVNSTDNLFHIGMSEFFKVPDRNKETRLRHLTLSGSGVTYLKSPKLQYVAFDDVRSCIESGIECYCMKEKWMAQGEWMAMLVNQNQVRQYRAHGGYIQLGYLIRGNNYAYDYTDALPLMPTDSKSLLVAVRYDMTNLNSSHANLYGGRQQDFSIGLNCYFNKYLSTRLNYSYVRLDEFSPIGEVSFHAFQARLQFRF